MGKIESSFCYFSIFYLVNYLWIERYFPIIGKLNLVNIIVLVFLLAFLINIPYLVASKMNWINFSTVILFIVVIFAGLMGSVLYSYQGWQAVLLDLFLFSRFIVVFAVFSTLISEKNKQKLMKFFVLNLKVLMIINFGLLIINIPMHVFPTMDVRSGIASQQLIYSHPTYLATTSFLAWALISGNKSKIYQLMAIILMISTMRSKILILIAVYAFYTLIIKRIKIPAIRNILSIVSATTLGYNSFSDVVYTRLISPESSVRANIMGKAVAIAKDHFPFGAGFATYGSYSSFLHYSPLYGLYGLSNTYGFLESSYQYGMDSYVSMLMAQFGFFGLGASIIMIALILLTVVGNIDLEKKKTIGLIALFLIMSCFTESIINTGLGILIFAFLGLNYEKNNYD